MANYTKEINHNNRKYEISVFDETDGFSVHIYSNGKLCIDPIKFGIDTRMEFINMPIFKQCYETFVKWAETLPESKKNENVREFLNDYRKETQHLDKQWNNWFYRYLVNVAIIFIENGFLEDISNTE